MKKEPITIKQPNVSAYDYAKMAAQSNVDSVYEKEKKAFKEYKELENKIDWNEKLDYEMWLASATFEEVEIRRAGRKVKVTQVVGVRLNGNKPIQITRMSKRMADEFNKHVSIDHLNSKYMFIATPANIKTQREAVEKTEVEV
jgi:phosphoserine phosphatase